MFLIFQFFNFVQLHTNLEYGARQFQRLQELTTVILHLF